MLGPRRQAPGASAWRPWPSACAVALPIGLYLGPHRARASSSPSTSRTSAARCPPLALLAFFVAYLGVGFIERSCSSLMLLAHPADPDQHLRRRHARSTRDTVDAARGMGMTERQIIRQVELPLALPTIFGGIRTSAVNVVATATIAPLAQRQLARHADHHRATSTAPPAGWARPSLVALLTLAIDLLASAVCSGRSRPRGSSWRAAEAAEAPFCHPLRRRETATMKSRSHHAGASRRARAGARPRRVRQRRRGQRRRRRRLSGGGRRAIKKNPANNGKTDHDRLEELHRAVHPRRDLRRRRSQAAGLQGQEVAQPRLRGDGLQGAEAGRGRRLPRVHGHGADVVLQGQGRRGAEGAAGRPSTRSRPGREGDDITALPPTPFENTYRLAMTKETVEKLGKPEDDLGPGARPAGPEDLGLPGVQAADRLPARAWRRPTAEVREVRRRPRSSTTCSTTARPTSSFGFTTDGQLTHRQVRRRRRRQEACSRPTTSRC